MYGKLFASLYQGTLRGDSRGILVFTCLIAHMDQHGVVDMHPRAIAEAVGLSQEQVREALDALEAPDAESRSPELDGRRIVRIDEHRAWGWRVVNGPKYRAIRSEEDRREQNRLAQARWRERHGKASADVSQSKPESAEVSRDNPKQKQEAYAEKTNTRTARGACVSATDLVYLGVDRQAAEDWLAIRKAKRLPLTVTALAKVEREASAAGLSLSAAVSMAAASGWAGFRADWAAAQPSTQEQAAEARKRAQEAETAAIRDSIDRAGLNRVASLVAGAVKRA